MINRLRNPFLIRAADKIETDASFLRLFSPIVLESLIDKHSKEELWQNILFIRSSPGGGKTSLLRLFQPSSLLTLYSHKSAYKELCAALEEIAVVSEDGIETLGVFLQCTRNYEILEDLNISPAQVTRLFFSLINSRIILSTLKSILILKKMQFPDGLSKIGFRNTNATDVAADLPIECNGETLYGWAANIEKKVFQAIDSFTPYEEIRLEGHDELFAFSLLSPENLFIENKPICQKFLFMLDDAHKLSIKQRNSLQKYLIEKRGRFNIWISERLEALEPRENIGAYEKRDFQEINLEEFWKQKPKEFEKVLSSIAEKRAQLSTEYVDFFQENLEGEIDESLYQEQLNNAILQIQERFHSLGKDLNRFQEWFEYTDNFKGSPLEKLQLYKEAEIIIQRNLNKDQLSLELNYTKQQLLETDDTSVKTAARLFISQDVGLPFYHGFINLVKISSFNIEQFLTFAGNLYEEMLSRNIASKNIRLSPEAQEKVLKKVSDSKLNKLSRVVPYNKSVISFLNKFAELARQETYKGNAPYAPGVTGIGIKIHRGVSLFDEQDWFEEPLYDPLVNVLSACVAYNIIDIRTDVNQGKKGEKWMVIYLNRWLCLQFRLPLTYGGWRPKTPDELMRWV